MARTAVRLVGGSCDVIMLTGFLLCFFFSFFVGVCFRRFDVFLLFNQSIGSDA